jgi:hypothetical protein
VGGVRPVVKYLAGKPRQATESQPILMALDHLLQFKHLRRQFLAEGPRHSGEDWNNRNRLAGKADHGRSRDGERLSINVGFTPGVARLQNTGRSEVLSR